MRLGRLFSLLKVLKNIKYTSFICIIFVHTNKTCIFAYRLLNDNTTLSKRKVNGKNNHLIKNFMEAINSQSIKAAKYSRSNVMTTAWALVKQLGYKISEALAIAWKREKARAKKAYVKLSKEEKAVINGKKTIKHTEITLDSMTSEEIENITNFYFNF